MLAAATAAVLEGLQGHVIAGTGCVIETHLDLAAMADQATADPAHELGPRHTFAAEALAHLAARRFGSDG